MSEPYGTLGAIVPENDDYASGGADVPKAFREFSDSLGEGQGAGKILIAQSTGAAAFKAMGGDVSTNSSGVTQIGSSKLATGMYQAASVTDAKLASPNNGVYRHLLQASSGNFSNLPAGTYILSHKESLLASGGSFLNISVPLVPFDNAYYDVASKTQKLRLLAAISANGSKPAAEFTFSLRPITPGGGAGAFTLTAGEAVADSSVEINEPAANQTTRATGADFDVPADGTYGLAVVTNALASTPFLLNVVLQVRNV